MVIWLRSSSSEKKHNKHVKKIAKLINGNIIGEIIEVYELKSADLLEINNSQKKSKQELH